MAAASVLTAPDHTFEDFLASEESKDLLRFTTAGSVDDGKSTLIGRLLYDSRSVYDDQLESVTKASVGRNAGTVDFSLLTDGLRAEREQGITIDVAYRYFATPRRKFIIADTPGHEQYTRNMVTGASTADLAIVLVDARKGVLPQSRRHAYISSLLGLSHIVVAVNKMDLVDFSESIFSHIETEFRRFLSHSPFIEPVFIPISALAGDNVVARSKAMPWFHGPCLLEHLETVPVGDHSLTAPFRFPVQRVVRPNHEFRGYAGTVASGHIRVGDPVTVLPSGRKSSIANIATFDGDLADVDAGQAVTLCLADEIDITRGDVLVAPDHLPQTSTSIEATLVWLNETPAELKHRYRIKHTTRQDWADLAQIRYRLNINTLDHEPADKLEMNSIASVIIETARPLTFDSYNANRLTGSFILIDPATNATVAAGMIAGAVREKHHETQKAAKQSGPLTHKERVARQGHSGAIIRIPGRPNLSWRLERLLFERGCTVFSFPDSEAFYSENLLAAGAIVILESAPAADFRIQTLETPAGTPTPTLPQHDTEALTEIERILERMQILHSPPIFGDAGGI